MQLLLGYGVGSPPVRLRLRDRYGTNPSPHWAPATGSAACVIGDSYHYGVAPRDIEESSVLAAIAEFDKLGAAEFLKRYDFGPSSNALWVYVSYLRAKLEADGEPRLLQTVRGLGYVLREQE